MDPPPDAFTPISQLDPSIDTSAATVRGVVTLVWPYSSTRKSLSLLLVEPDFRLRRDKGQVRVTFKRACAKAIARAGIHGGDEIRLKLTGCRWLDETSTIQTPGRSVGWELGFDREVHLELRPETGEAQTIAVEKPATLEPLRPFTPPPVRTPVDHASPISPTSYISTTSTWSTSAFRKRKRRDLSSSFAGGQYDFLADESLNVEQTPKRFKASAGSRRWRVTGRSPSPEATTPSSSAPARINANEVLSPDAGDEKGSLLGPSISPTARSRKAVPLFADAIAAEKIRMIPEPKTVPSSSPQNNSLYSSFDSGQATPSFLPEEHPARLLTFGSGFTETSTPYSSWPPLKQTTGSQPQADHALPKPAPAEIDHGAGQQDDKAGQATVLSHAESAQSTTLPENRAKDPAQLSVPLEASEDQTDLSQEQLSQKRLVNQGDRRNVISFDFAQIAEPLNLAQPANPVLPSPSDSTALQTQFLTDTFLDLDAYSNATYDPATVTFDMSTQPGEQDPAAFPQSPTQTSFWNPQYSSQIPLNSLNPPQKLVKRSSFDAGQGAISSSLKDGTVLGQPGIQSAESFDTLSTSPAGHEAQMSPPERQTHPGPGGIKHQAISAEPQMVAQSASALKYESQPIISGQTTENLLTETGPGNAAQQQRKTEPEVIELSSDEESSDEEVTDLRPHAEATLENPNELHNAENFALSEENDIQKASSESTQRTEEMTDEDYKTDVSRADNGRFQDVSEGAGPKQQPSDQIYSTATAESKHSSDNSLTLDDQRGIEAAVSGAFSTHKRSFHAESAEPTVNQDIEPQDTNKIDVAGSSATIGTQELHSADANPPIVSELSLINQAAEIQTSFPQDSNNDVSLEHTDITHASQLRRNPSDKDVVNTHDDSTPVSESTASKALGEQEGATNLASDAVVSAANPSNPLKELETHENRKSEEQPVAEASAQSAQVPRIGTALLSYEEKEVEPSYNEQGKSSTTLEEHHIDNDWDSSQSRNSELVNSQAKAFPVPMASRVSEKQPLKTSEPADVPRSTRATRQSRREVQGPHHTKTQAKIRGREDRLRPVAPSDTDRPAEMAENSTSQTNRARDTRKRGSVSKSEQESTANKPERITDPVSAQLLAEATEPIAPLSSLPVTQGRRTRNAYFAPLSNLHQHINGSVDIVSVVVACSPAVRAPSGPRDWHNTLYITDVSLTQAVTGTALRSVQFFRPRRGAIPRAVQAGDVLLAHNLKAQTRRGRPFLISTAASGWVVFSPAPISSTWERSLVPSVKFDGPPLDRGPEELELTKDLGIWWESLGTDIRTALKARASEAIERVLEAARRKSGRKRIAQPGEVTHELRNGSQYPFTDTRLLNDDFDGTPGPE